MNDYRKRALKRLRMRLDKIIPITLLILIIASFVVWYCHDLSINPRAEPDNAMLTVRFLDVGQGDAILIGSPDGTDMLIDAGSSVSDTRLAAYLGEYCRGKLEYLLLTHFDYDHIGGAEKVFEYCEVGELIIPEKKDDSALLRSILSYRENEADCALVYAHTNDTFILGDAVLTLLASPEKDSPINDNNDCIVAKLTYKKNSFLFSGDLEGSAEKELVETCADALVCDVLKIAHHGSASSTTEAFLTAVSPAVAVISCGKDNTFGHPSAQVLDRLESFSIKYYRTDLEGTLTLQSDGTKIYKLK